MKNMFPKDFDAPPTSVEYMVCQQTRVVSEILHNIEELEKLRRDVSIIRKKRTNIQCSCRELMSELKDPRVVKNDTPDTQEHVERYVTMQCNFRRHPDWFIF